MTTIEAITMTLLCCGCGRSITARLTNGAEIYPQRTDLHALPFWRCDTCGNYVGCHHKTSAPTTPLGCIPTPEIRSIRKQIHALLDPIWQRGHMTRRALYHMLSARIGKEYHAAQIASLDEAHRIYQAVEQIRKEAPRP